jgi:hypothetical protein
VVSILALARDKEPEVYLAIRPYGHI